MSIWSARSTSRFASFAAAACGRAYDSLKTFSADATRQLDGDGIRDLENDGGTELGLLVSPIFTGRKRRRKDVNAGVVEISPRVTELTIHA